MARRRGRTRMDISVDLHRRRWGEEIAGAEFAIPTDVELMQAPGTNMCSVISCSEGSEHGGWQSLLWKI